MFPRWSHWQIQYTQKGLLEQRVRQVLRVSVLVAAIVGTYQFRNAGGKLNELPGLLRQYVRFGLQGVLEAVGKGLRQVQSYI